MTLAVEQTFADGALVLSRQGDSALLTLSRPDRRNALNLAMWTALPHAVAAVETEPDCKVLVLAGAGDHFAAGADISEFATVYATRESTAAYATTMSKGLDSIATLSKPTLARIRGACVGAGVALALACDVRLAADDARLGVTPGKLGLMYTLADTKRLVDAVGGSAAKDILFTGRLLDAAEAVRLGLVDFVHPVAALESAVDAKTQAISACSQWSTRRAKAVVAMILAGALLETDQTKAWFLDAMEGDDFREGRDAFLARRTPVFPFR